jgi:hypothetical protein
MSSMNGFDFYESVKYGCKNQSMFFLADSSHYSERVKNDQACISNASFKGRKSTITLARQLEQILDPKS